MSGLYLPGMNMPKSCHECFCMEEEDLFCRITERAVGGEPDLYPWNPRPDNCPLIPVPEHGDLIDKKDVVPKDGYIIADGIACIPIKDIVNAPTIIPASEEGEG